MSSKNSTLPKHSGARDYKSDYKRLLKDIGRVILTLVVIYFMCRGFLSICLYGVEITHDVHVGINTSPVAQSVSLVITVLGTLALLVIVAMALTLSMRVLHSAYKTFGGKWISSIRSIANRLKRKAT
jgi:hypothetical protein